MAVSSNSAGHAAQTKMARIAGAFALAFVLASVLAGLLGHIGIGGDKDKDIYRTITTHVASGETAVT